MNGPSRWCKTCDTFSALTPYGRCERCFEILVPAKRQASPLRVVLRWVLGILVPTSALGLLLFALPQAYLVGEWVSTHGPLAAVGAISFCVIWLSVLLAH